MEANIFNYTTSESFSAEFPMTEDEINELLAKGEIMVDGCPYVNIGGVGMTIREFNDFTNTERESRQCLVPVRMKATNGL